MITETDHLLLSALQLSDAPFMLELVNSAGWLQFIGDRNIKDIAAAENYIVNGPMVSYMQNGFGLWLVALKEPVLSIGICGIIKRDTLPHPDIGFAFLPAWSGKGFAYQSATSVLAYARHTLNLKKILAITMHENIRSINLLTRLGLIFEKEIRLPHTEQELMLFTTV